ncbi:hypothetical protein Lupro_05965 [Lutibacter profundi]|uniref:AraC effector-binding domain-containing protein n=1 Tax=Lutibacter profundi TaxID=1622118 RepID=A0A0X8G6A1_9FLAO|nr:effector binding domain-containing protein [Lutibacter profundi]AMC10814.1 hypothetical protein Lupro_05965 [Lutibacter profundi]
MRFLKYIFYLLLILIIGVSIYIATLDGSYNIKQSKVIKAPIEVVFNVVNDFRSWQNWGTWFEIDSTIVASFPKVTSGVGASYSWSGAGSNGSIKTLSLIPNKEIIQQIDFGTGSTSEVYWLFNNSNNGTKITWGMKGKSNFMEKLHWLTQGGIEKNMTPIYNRGLALLNNYILKELEKHAIEIKGVVYFGGGYYLYQTTSSKINDFEFKMKKMLTKILNYMKNNNINASGKPFTITHKWDEENQTTMFSTCVPIKERIITTEDILTGFLKPQKTFKTILKGDYKFSFEAWQATFKAINEQGFVKKQDGEPFEVYTVGPRENVNPSKWITEIYVPIK